MKLPMSWLRDWVEVEAAPDRIADALTTHGFYVEQIETHGEPHPGVVVARVIEVGRHPNADKLSLCRVDSGAGEVRVVCGAPNVRDGMLVPLATVGAKLPGGVIIRRSKIRGQESQGMLCSARELGLSDDHEGIVDLARTLGEAASGAVGRPLDELLPPPDEVLEIEVPFNRPDGLGVVGLAREVRAALGGRWTDAARERLSARWSGNDDFDLALEDREGCPHYLAQAIEGVRVGPSPEWLQRRLAAAGQRSINDVVDLTNLVLFEFGQPLHAFDLDRLEGPAIRVRRARAGERLTTLDAVERTLDPEVLVIADARRPVAIAGVMGGAESEVAQSSARLLLECAWFQPRRVRRGAKALGLSTEASKRFERGVDPAIGPAAAARFLSLLAEIQPQARLGAARERRSPGEPPRPIALRRSRLRRVTGAEIPGRESVAALEALEFRVAGDDPLEVTPPSWRVDVTLEDDLVEDVARGWGYDRIPEAPPGTRGLFAVRDGRERATARARAAMLSRGVGEAWCTTLVSEREALDAAALLGDAAPGLVRLQNPMSRESEVLRPNPIPGLLRACAHNLRQGVAAVRLFEIGPGFRAGDGPLPEERPMLAAVVTGPRWAHAHDASQGPVDFEDAKGLWEAWLEEMRVDTPEWRAYAAPGWKPGASAEVVSGTSRIAWAGTLAAPLLRGWDIEVPVHAFVASLEAVPSSGRRTVGLPGRFPPVTRDLAFFVPVRVTHLELERVLAAAAGTWLDSIELFDVYQGPGTPEGMKSLAFALRFQHPERTLQDPEVQDIQDRMVAAVARSCDGRLRER